MARTKSKAANVAVPQSREEAVEAIACIGRRLRERRRIETAMNDEMAAVKERYSVQAAPILADPEAVRGIAGITIVQSEEIVIEPYETALEEVV